MSYTPTEIGARIKLAREEWGETRTALAARLGISRQALTRFESGEQVPSVRRLCDICDALGLDPGALLRE